MIKEHIFYALNPWQSPTQDWRLDESLVRRTSTARLIQQLDGAYIQVVVGARRAGKTVVLHQCIDHLLRDQGIPPRNVF